MWLAEKGCGELVEGIWQANYEVVEEKKVLRKLDTCSRELTRWSKECFGNIKHKLKKKKKTIKSGQEEGCTRWGRARMCFCN